MRIVGFSVEDSASTGVEGEVSLGGLTLLFGPNGSGKSLLLESLGSLLHRDARWVGRRARLNDESYAVGHLYLTGDWAGDDWPWLQRVIAAPLDQETRGSLGLPDASNRTWQTLRQFIEAVAVADGCGALMPQVDQLMPALVIGYQPHEHGHVHAAVDARLVPDDVRSSLLQVGRSLGDRPLAQRLIEIAASTYGFPVLVALNALDETAFPPLRLRPPRTLRFGAEVTDAEAVLIAAMGMRWLEAEPDGWLEESDNGRYDVRTPILAAMRDIEERAVRYSLPFVLERGRPAVQVPAPELWSRTGRVVLGLRDYQGVFTDARRLSKAFIRWLNISIVLATDDWLIDNEYPFWDTDWSSGAPIAAQRSHFGIAGRIVLIDEPELHLHPVAASQVAQWLLAMAAGDTRVLAATHSPAIIDATGNDVSLIGVTRTEGRSTLVSLAGDLLGSLDEYAGALGVDRATWVQSVRALMLVEGEHDLRVVQKFFGDELASHRAAIVPLRGHKNLTSGTVILEFFKRLEIPIRVLLDDVTPADVSGDLSAPPSTSEGRLARQLTLSAGDYPMLQVLAYPEPDIICALPLRAVRAAFPEAADVPWDEIAQAWRSLETQVGFKTYALKRLGLAKVATPDLFVARVLDAVSDEDRPSEALATAMDHLFDSLAEAPPSALCPLPHAP